MAVPRRTQVLLLSALVISSLLSYDCTLYGASVIGFGMGYHVFVITWLYAVRREYDCLWFMLSHLCCRMAVRCMARVSLRLAFVFSALLSHCCTPCVASIVGHGPGCHIFAIVRCPPHGTSIVAFGLGYLSFVIVWLYDVGREYYCLWAE